MKHTICLILFLPICAAAYGADVARIPATDQWESILPSKEAVRVAPFDLYRAPITNAQFLAFVKSNAQWQRQRVPSTFADRGYLQHWEGPLVLGSQARPQQPVTSVSWFAARAYCESVGARLPTWYEWEVAAAASGSERDARTDPGWRQQILQWYSHPSNRPLPLVKQGPANLYGVRDLHGLVWEWVEDFSALMISPDSREQGDPEVTKFCGSGALALQDRENYAVAMRLALLSSLQANHTTANLGFRCAVNAPAPSEATASPVLALPADSLYQFDPPLQVADGSKTRFAVRHKRARIVTMFYANCPMACPLTIETLRQLDAALSTSERTQLEILLLSLDPDRDTPEVLKQVAHTRRISDERWTLARASASDTRKLAALLDVRYRAMQDGEFNHTSVLVLLDGQGRVIGRSERLGTPDPAFLAQVRAALAKK